MNPSALDSLISEITSLAALVGFAQADSAHPLCRDLPANAYALVSSYGWLVVWPVPDVSDPALLRADRMAEDHFTEAFPPEAGQAGAVVDGYVVLALPSAPGPDMAEVRRVRLKRSVCRRAVVWYDEQELRWHGIDSITVLAVPGLGSNNGPRGLPDLSAEEMNLLDDIGTDGKRAAQLHLAEIAP